MWRKETAPPTLDMFSCYNRVPEALKLSFCDRPCATTVMLLEVSDVLKEDISGLVLFQDGDDVVEQRSPGVELAVLESRLRKWLTREARAEDVVWRDFAVVSSNIANEITDRTRKVSNIQLAQLVVHLGREHTLVAEGFEREVEAAKPREKINELQALSQRPLR